MNFISMFFASMRVASKLDLASHHAKKGDSDELIDELCTAGPGGRGATRSPAGSVEIDDESLPHPA